MVSWNFLGFELLWTLQLSSRLCQHANIAEVFFNWKYAHVAHSCQKVMEKREGAREGRYKKVFLLRDAMGYLRQ